MLSSLPSSCSVWVSLVSVNARLPISNSMADVNCYKRIISHLTTARSIVYSIAFVLIARQLVVVQRSAANFSPNSSNSLLQDGKDRKELPQHKPMATIDLEGKSTDPYNASFILMLGKMVALSPFTWRKDSKGVGAQGFRQSGLRQHRVVST